MARVPDLLVEQLVLGELDEKRAAEIRAALEAEPGGAERIEALRTSSARILAQHPPALVRREVERRLGRPLRRSRSTAWLIPAAALAAAAVAIVVLPSRQPTEDSRVKGETAPLRIYRQSGGALERLHAGDAAHPGDLIQVAIAGPHAFAAVVSLDGAGGVTVHYPDGPRALPVEAGEHPLPRAFQLDAAPRFERFVLVTSDRPFDVATVVSASRAMPDAERPLSLPAGLQQTSLLIRKVSP